MELTMPRIEAVCFEDGLNLNNLRGEDPPLNSYRSLGRRWVVSQAESDAGIMVESIIELRTTHHGAAVIAGRPDRCYTVTVAHLAREPHCWIAHTHRVGGDCVEWRRVPAARYAARDLERLHRDAIAELTDRLATPAAVDSPQAARVRELFAFAATYRH